MAAAQTGFYGKLYWNFKVFRVIVLSITLGVWTFLATGFGTPAMFLGIRKLSDWWVVYWGKIGLKIIHVNLEVEGRENIPDTGAIYIFNHTCFIDIMIMFAALRTSLRFGAKEELFKVPVFGHFLKAAGFLPIARARSEEVFRIYSEAKSRLADRTSFILAPEGKRTDGREIAPFKSGPVVFAIEAGAPIVPVVLCGVTDAWSTEHSCMRAESWSYTVNVKILPPVSTEGLSVKSDRKKLSADLRSSMQIALAQMLRAREN